MELGSEKLKRVAVGCDPARNHGKLTGMSILAETIDAAIDPAPSKPGVVNVA